MRHFVLGAALCLAACPFSRPGESADAGESADVAPSGAADAQGFGKDAARAPEVDAGRSDTGAPDGQPPDAGSGAGRADAAGLDAGPTVDAGAATALPQIPVGPKPTVEAETFSASGDIADDSAIYANATDPSRSVVIADNKDDAAGGIGVFDMQGRLLQFRPDGMIGNVDLRADFPLAGNSIVLVGANNRSDDSLIFWALDPQTQRLSPPIGLSNPTVSRNYGFCLYHSARTGKFYAFVTQETGASTLEQYELTDEGGRVRASRVRSLAVGSISEGCVADDELGRLYVAQEDIALWRYGAEPGDGSSRVAVASVGDGHIAADVEGLALAKGPGTSGYLVASSQAENRFAVYDRETNAFVRNFKVGANGAIDAVEQTDGVDISTANLGPGFEHGALVVHDGENKGGSTSNLKYVPLVLP